MPLIISAIFAAHNHSWKKSPNKSYNKYSENNFAVHNVMCYAMFAWCHVQHNIHTNLEKLNIHSSNVGMTLYHSSVKKKFFFYPVWCINVYQTSDQHHIFFLTFFVQTSNLSNLFCLQYSAFFLLQAAINIYMNIRQNLIITQTHTLIRSYAHTHYIKNLCWCSINILLRIY